MPAMASANVRDLPDAKSGATQEEGHDAVKRDSESMTVGDQAHQRRAVSQSSPRFLKTANPTTSERRTGIISLVGAAVVAISVFLPYVKAGSGNFLNSRTPFQFGSYSQFSSNGLEILFGTALIAFSGLRFLKVIYLKKGPNSFGLFISCVIASYIVNDVWTTSGRSGSVRLAYGGAIGYVGVGIEAIALTVCVTTRNSDEPGTFQYGHPMPPGRILRE